MGYSSQQAKAFINMITPIIVAEGGFCTAIHINKKKRKDEANG